MSIVSLIFGVLVEGQRKHVFWTSAVAPKFRNLGPKCAQEATSPPRLFADPTSPGGEGPWGGLANEVNLDSSSKNHEMRIMRHEKKYEA